MAYYRDVREYLNALEAAGKLVRIKQPINKDTEMHPLVRLQYRGLPEEQRRAFLFEKVIDIKGRTLKAGPSKIPVVVACYAGNFDIYALGMQCKKEEIYGKWARAQSHPVEPVEVQSGPCQERVISGDELKQRGMGHGGLGFFVNVNCITMRKNPVYVAFLSQFPPSESSKIRGVVRAEPRRADDFVEVFVGAFLDLYHQIATASAALMHCDIEQIV